mgnify:CR=1 FL=1
MTRAVTRGANSDPDRKVRRPGQMREGLKMTVDNLSAPVVAVDEFDFGPATGLVCRECGAHYGLGAAYACMECFGPLEVTYSYGEVTREQIEAGPSSLWRSAPLLPVSKPGETMIWSNRLASPPKYSVPFNGRCRPL